MGLLSLEKNRPSVPAEIVAIILKFAMSSFRPSSLKHLKMLSSLCMISYDAYRIATARLYRTVILISINRLSLFLRTTSNNTYLASQVINIWIGDTGLKRLNTEVQTNRLILPPLPNLERFAINGQNTPVEWSSLSCIHLTVSDLQTLSYQVPTLRILHLINPLVSVDALRSILHSCPSINAVVLELTERIGFETLMQLAMTVIKSAPSLRKLTFRIEDFWILHRTMCMVPARLTREGLKEQMKGKKIGAVWSWELGMDVCGVWLANVFNRKVGKEHRVWIESREM